MIALLKSVNAKEGLNGLTAILGELSALRKTLGD